MEVRKDEKKVHMQWYGKSKYCIRVAVYGYPPPITTDDWDKVTCKQCLMLRDKEINKIFIMKGNPCHENS